MSKKAEENQQLSFEQAMAKLEAVVTQLENGDVPLEQAIALYQEGMQLSQFCAEKLKQVETQIEMLVEGETGSSRKNFPSNQEDR